MTENNENNTSINTNLQMQKFDIEKYESKLKNNPSYEGYQKDKNTFVKQYHIIKDGYVEETYNRKIVENYVEELITDDRFREICTYDNQGLLQSVKYFFGTDLEIGDWKYYKNEKLTKTENKDSGYDFSIYQVIKYGKKNNVNFLKTGDIKKVKHEELKTSCWEIIWNTGKISSDAESYTFKKVILDGKTGRELSSKEFIMNPLSR